MFYFDAYIEDPPLLPNYTIAEVTGKNKKQTIPGYMCVHAYKVKPFL